MDRVHGTVKMAVSVNSCARLVTSTTFWHHFSMPRVINKNSSKNGFALGFEGTLWAAADKLHGKSIRANLSGLGYDCGKKETPAPISRKRPRKDFRGQRSDFTPISTCRQA
jgi:hypothetical protein